MASYSPSTESFDAISSSTSSNDSMLNDIEDNHPLTHQKNTYGWSWRIDVYALKQLKTLSCTFLKYISFSGQVISVELLISIDYVLFVGTFLVIFILIRIWEFVLFVIFFKSWQALLVAHRFKAASMKLDIFMTWSWNLVLDCSCI